MPSASARPSHDTQTRGSADSLAGLDSYPDADPDADPQVEEGAARTLPLKSWAKRCGWFIALWLAGVTVVSLLALLIRTALLGA